MQHQHNIWFDAVIKQLDKTLAELLEDDLSKMCSVFQMSTENDDLLCCMEKKFGLTANFINGHVSIFENWI